MRKGLKMKSKIATLITIGAALALSGCSAETNSAVVNSTESSMESTTQVVDETVVEVEQEAADESAYVYGYMPLSYAEYWASELGGSTEAFEEGSQILDREGMYDTGMYDGVTRATTKHGLFRQQFQYTIEVTGAKILSSETVEENGREKTTYITDENDQATIEVQATYVGLDEDEEMMYETVEGLMAIGDVEATFDLGEGDQLASYQIVDYKVFGFNKIPVAIPVELIDTAEANGFMQSNEVDAATYGLKIMQADGAFGKRQTEGTVGDELVVADEAAITTVYNTRYGSDAEAYVYLKNRSGAELTIEEFIAYCARFQTAQYDYYGDDSTYTTLVGSYGSKHGADTWWSDHHGIRIDCGINYSFDRFEGAGPGYYKITLIADGYKDVEAYVRFNEAYAEDVEATIVGSELILEGLSETAIVGTTYTVTKGEGREQETLLDNLSLEGRTQVLACEIMAGETYNITLNLAAYQPLSFSVEAQ